MKKNLFWLLTIILPLFSYWLDINIPTPENIEKLADQNNTIILDEWTNTIWADTNWITSKVAFNTNNNLFLTQQIKNYKTSINITCKNGYITNISWYPISWNWQTEQAILSYNYNLANHKYDNTVTIKCQPIANPAKELEENVVNANYQTISKPQNDNIFSSKSYNLSSDTDPTITTEEIKEQLSAWKNISNQPTFVNVLFLQLKTIWNLSSTLLLEKPEIEFKNLFSNINEFTEYTSWLEKFKNYSNLNDFVNAFTWTIWLKDIWIANNVINWLLKCLNSNICTNSIQLKHNPLDKFDVYNFKEIENSLYKDPTQNILSWSIIYYQKLKSTCENPPTVEWDFFLINQINYTCQELLKSEIDPANSSDATNFQLWYALWLRINNLKNIQSNIPTSWINLKWIFNIFRELNNLTVWTTKMEIIKKVNKETSLTGKYETFNKILQTDLQEIKNNKISDITTATKKANIIQTALKALTPWTDLNNTVKSKDPNIKLIDDNNFEVTDWKATIKGINIVSNNTTLTPNDDDDEISSAELEVWNLWMYNNLKITYNDGHSENFVKVFIWKYILNNWRYPRWVYYDRWIITDFENCAKDPNNYWSTYYIKIPNSNYYECLKETRENHKKIIVYCRWFKWCFVKEDD